MIAETFEILLSFHLTTLPPVVEGVVPAISLNIVFLSAPSSHNVHPPIEVGSKPHMFLELAGVYAAIIQLEYYI